MKGGSTAYNSVNALYNSNCLTNHTNEVNFGGGNAKIAGTIAETQTGGGHSPADFGNAFTATRDFIGVGQCDTPTTKATVTQKAGRRRRRRRKSSRRTRKSSRRSRKSTRRSRKSTRRSRKSSRRRRQRGGNKIPNQPLWGDKVQINHPGNQVAGHVQLDGQTFSAVADPFRVLPGPHAARITGDLNASGYEGVSSGRFSGGKRRRRRSRRTNRR